MVVRQTPGPTFQIWGLPSALLIFLDSNQEFFGECILFGLWRLSSLFSSKTHCFAFSILLGLGHFCKLDLYALRFRETDYLAQGSPEILFPWIDKVETVL